MILVVTHNGRRPLGSERYELNSPSCSPVSTKYRWIRIDRKRQERILETKFDCHRCLGITYTGVIRLKEVGN